MKFKITFKTPNVSDQIRDQLSTSFSGEELEEELEDAIDSTSTTIKKFVEYDENITIEFDTDTQSAEVLPK